MLEVADLDQHYGDLQALFGISLRVEEGETVAIVGANGAGKSTLLKTIAGLLRAPAETVRFDGRSIAETPAFARVMLGIAMVPEGRRVFPSLSVEENLSVGSFGRRRGPWDLPRVYGSSRSWDGSPTGRLRCCRAANSRPWRSAGRLWRILASC